MNIRGIGGKRYSWSRRLLCILRTCLPRRMEDLLSNNPTVFTAAKTEKLWQMRQEAGLQRFSISVKLLSLIIWPFLAGSWPFCLDDFRTIKLRCQRREHHCPISSQITLQGYRNRAKSPPRLGECRGLHHILKQWLKLDWINASRL